MGHSIQIVLRENLFPKMGLLILKSCILSLYCKENHHSAPNSILLAKH